MGLVFVLDNCFILTIAAEHTHREIGVHLPQSVLQKSKIKNKKWRRVVGSNLKFWKLGVFLVSNHHLTSKRRKRPLECVHHADYVATKLCA